MSRPLIQEINSNSIETEENPTPTLPTQASTSKTTNKDLLRFEKPIFNVYDKDKYASEKEFMIKKLMKESKKPNFEMLPKSSRN